MIWLKKVLTPPRFDDEGKTQQAFMLHVILWTLVCVPLPLLLYHLLFAADNLQRTLVQTLVAEAINIVLLLMLRRGHVWSASVIQASAFWLFFTLTSWTGGGVRGESYLIGYTLVIAVAGILLGGRGAAIFTILSLASGILMVIAETRGWKSRPFTLDPPLTSWVVSLMLFPVGAMLQYLASRALRKALARARASEENYRLISQITSDYTFSTELDSQGRMRLNWVAGAFERITGYTYEDYVAAGGWRSLLYPDDIPEDDRAMETLLANQKVISEVRTYNRAGQLRWARVYAHPVWDREQNRLIGIVGAVRDTTGQKQAEQALRTSEAIYRQAIEVAGAVPYHQMYAGQNVIYDFIGEGILGMTGYSAAEFNETVWDSLAVARTLLGELGNYPWEEAVQRVRRGDYPIWQCEHCIRTRDGSIRWIFEAAVELRDENGVSHGSVGMFQDITERKLTEQRKARQRMMLEKVIHLGKQLTEVSDLWTTLHKIWHGVHDDLEFDRLAIFLYNKERNSMDSTLGTDIRGQKERTWGLWFPIDEGTIFKVVLEHPDGVYFTHNYDREYPVPPEDEMYGVKDFAALAAWAGDKPVAVICADNVVTGRPITDEQVEALRLYSGYAGLAIENARLNESLQTELQQRKTFIEQLEAKNTELERFTYTVSHDLKSPLVTITGFLGYLEKDALAGDIVKVRASAERISTAAKKMERLLSDLLELSRIGRLVNPPENIPFADIVGEALEHVRGRLEANQVEVVVQEDLPVVRGDRMRLVEIVQNLLDNAAKFTGGKPSPRVEVGAAGLDENQHHILFVCDNGLGIEPRFHERIFGLFNKLNPGIEGTGIGLTLVKRIIEVHGGRIWVKSEPGTGTTFYFTLPAEQP